jgi:thiol:disulfide interchange protein
MIRIPRPSLLVALAAFPALGVALGSVPGCGGGRQIENTPVPAGKTVPFDPPESYPAIDWSLSLAEARMRASEEHKPMLLFVRAAWSRPSVVMDETIWKDTRILAEAPRFVAVKVDLTSNYGEPIPASLHDYTVETVPTTIVLGSDGHVTGRFVVGAARAADVARAMQQAK